MYALYLNGEKLKETNALPCADQDIVAMNARMQEGYEWRTIVEDETPAHDPVYQVVITKDYKTAGKKLRREKKVWNNPDWQVAARAVIADKLNGYFSFRELARDLVMRTNGPAIARAQAAVAHADALLAQIDAGEKPDLNAGWPALR
jgi:hypothetical protein